MGLYLECTECKRTYDDTESIEQAVKMKPDYYKDYHPFQPDGICPCPIMGCKGGLELKVKD